MRNAFEPLRFQANGSCSTWIRATIWSGCRHMLRAAAVQVCRADAFHRAILPARSIWCSRHVPQLGVLLRPLARYPSWVFCCAFWPDNGRPLHSAHCIRNRVPSIRFDAISQFAASALYSDTSLISPLLSASFCWLQIWFLLHCECGTAWPRVALLGMREITVNYYSSPPLFSWLLSSSFRACSGLASSLLLVPS